MLKRTALLLLVLVLVACGNQNHNSLPADVLLFNGTGISPNDLTAIETILDDNHISYAEVNSAGLNAMSQSQLMKYRLLIMPGGNFVDMGKSLNITTGSNIRQAVQDGLNYMGICAGAFLAGKSAYYNGFDLTNGITFHFYSAADKGIQKTPVSISLPNGVTLDQYWENGPQLSGWGSVVAKYTDGMPAVTQGKCGKGIVVLVGVHPEAPESWRKGMFFQTSAAVDNTYAATLIKAALRGETIPHY